VGALVYEKDFNTREQVTGLTLHNWNNADSPTEYESATPSLTPQIVTYLGYDGVNRLNAVIDGSYSRTLCYDQYGNGWTTAYSGTTPLPGNAPQEIGNSCTAGAATPYVAATNRLAGVSYDSKWQRNEQQRRYAGL